MSGLVTLKTSKVRLKNKAAISPDNGAISSNKTYVPPQGGNDNNFMFCRGEPV
jgi:hypothetical protein